VKTPTSADDNPQPFERIERIEPFEPHKPQKHLKPLKPPKPLYLYLLFICIKKGKFSKMVGAF
jgi:hypothetical protein